jgi:hypothetical protein
MLSTLPRQLWIKCGCSCILALAFTARAIHCMRGAIHTTHLVRFSYLHMTALYTGLTMENQVNVLHVVRTSDTSGLYAKRFQTLY